jgi:hypothetical protein
MLSKPKEKMERKPSTFLAKWKVIFVLGTPFTVKSLFCKEKFMCTLPNYQYFILKPSETVKADGAAA